MDHGPRAVNRWAGRGGSGGGGQGGHALYGRAPAPTILLKRCIHRITTTSVITVPVVRRRGNVVLPSERRLAILDEVRGRRVVRAESLAERFGVSLETVRRDLRALDREGRLRRVYGGASAGVRAAEGPVEQRQAQHADRKRAIAQAAAAVLNPDDTIFVDVGTTCLELARAVPSGWHGRVLTNALRVATELAGRPGVEVLLTGGQVRPGDLACSGPFAEPLFDSFFVTRAYIGAGGVHPEAGLTDYHPSEGVLRRRWIEQAGQVYVLADSSKLGTIAPYRVCDLGRVAAVVTDGEEHAAVIDELELSGVAVVRAGAPREPALAAEGSRPTARERAPQGRRAGALTR